MRRFCACSEQPQSIGKIRFLVAACPEAVKTTTENGWLPLHFACANKAPLELIQYGRAPLDCAKMPTADGGDPMSEVVSLLEAILLFPFYSRMNM
jgi:hypothetical protein